MQKQMTGIQSSIKGLSSEVSKGFKDLGNSAEQMNRSLGGSLDTFVGFATQFGKILAFRSLISVVNDVSRAFKEGVTNAADLSVRLGQMIAIQDDTTASMEDFRNAVLSASDATARPVNEAAFGLYQTLQNQIGDSTDAMYVFAQASLLAAANQTPLNDSVNLVTAALKGWNLSAREAGHVAGLFFEAIKIGRFEASDLSDIIGRLGPLAHALGVSLEEAMAAVAIMTQQGTRADTALTQLGAVMNALLKPSTALKAAMREAWGVESAEAAIARFGGILPLMAELEKMAHGTSNELATFFNNVRAIRGEMGLLGDSNEAAVDAMRRLRDATGETVQKAADLVLQTPGGAYKKALNELANAWVKLGDSFLPVATQAARAAKLLADNIQGVITIITAGTLAAGAAVLISSIGSLTLGFGSLTVAINVSKAALLAHPIFAGIAIGVAIGEAINLVIEKFKQADDEIVKHAAQAAEERTAKYLEELDKQVQAETNSFSKRIELASKSLSEITKLENRQYDSIVKLNASVLSQTKLRFDRILSLHQEELQKEIEAEAAAATKINSLRDSITKQKSGLADIKFTHDLEMRNLDEETKSRFELKRATDLLAEADRKRAQATTPDQFKAVEDIYNRAAKFAEAAASASEKNSATQRISNGLEEKAKEGLIKLDERQIELLKQIPGEYQKSIPILQDEQAEMKRLIGIIEEGLSPTKKGGEIKSAQEMADGYKAAMQALEDLIKLGEGKKNMAADILGISTLHNKLIEEFQGLPAIQAQIKTNWDEEVARMRTAFTLAPIEVRFKFALETLEKGGFQFDANTILGDPDTTKRIQDALEKGTLNWTNLLMTRLPQIKKEYADLLQEIETVTIKQKGLENSLQESAKSFRPPETIRTTRLTSIPDETGGTTLETASKLMEDYQEIIRLGNQLAQTGLGDPAFAGRSQRFVALVERMKNEMDKEGTWGLDINEHEWNAAIKMAEELEKQKDTITKNPAELKVKAQDLDEQLKAIESLFNQVKTNADGANTNIQQIETTTSGITNTTLPAMVSAWGTIPPSIQPAIDACGRLQNAALQALAAVNAANAAAASAASSMTAEAGGPVYRAGGGPIGSDRIPAWLTPGETVINARSSAKFFAQLSAINAGQTPIFRSAGGTVNNIGDINVNLTTQSTTSQLQAREMASALRRELRRGTSKL